MVSLSLYISNVYLILIPGIYLGKARWHWTAITTSILICHVHLFMWDACTIWDVILPSAAGDKKPPKSYPSHMREGMGEGGHYSVLPHSAPPHLCLRSWYFGHLEGGSGWYWMILVTTHLFPKFTRISLFMAVMMFMFPGSAHHCGGGLGRYLQGDYCHRGEWRCLTWQCVVTDRLQVLWDLGVIPTVSGTLPIRGSRPLHEGSRLFLQCEHLVFFT